MRYTHDLLSVLYPTNIHLVLRSAILEVLILFVFNTTDYPHVRNADEKFGTDHIQCSHQVAYFPLCFMTTNPSICVSVIIYYLKNFYRMSSGILDLCSIHCALPSRVWNTTSKI